jgi:signal peptidase I
MRTRDLTRVLAVLAITFALVLAMVVILPSSASLAACAGAPAATQPVVVAQGPMRPLLMPGDVVAVTKVAPSDVRRGEVVAFDPDGWPPVDLPDAAVVMRVIAVGGDEVDLQGGRVFVNGTELVEPYVFDGEATGPISDGVSGWHVPAGEVFVLGDHRSIAVDSRFRGPLPATSIIGIAVYRCGPAERRGPIG